MSEKPYIFDTKGTDIGRQHLSYVETIFDRTSTQFLEEIDIKPGQRCLDVGAGAGSITRWMADKVGDQGKVVALDKNVGYIEETANIETHECDVIEGLPVDGTFDVIHVRLLLMHLPQREAIFKTLVDALAPGGWLVIGDFNGRPQTAIEVPKESDRKVWEHVMYLSHGVVSPAMGIDFDWALTVSRHMEEAGLNTIDALEYSNTVRGGSAGCMMHLNLNMQAEPLLRKHGATTEEIERYRELMVDPHFSAWFYHFILTRGQKPTV
ncbi:MAG TPA: methyltransferase domain-containing protein [Stackebrandtia sp.]|jgi:SAM-dependent methyltransferase|uniref:class I SAM-dependent methyltransferase n=1 Tax=Stackebrandtia sp. TaxID=2023065 RepID=UPI002D2C91CD|nr:methyltransferase domain-containing protein [Stackebrandtia sp.]HZE37174.1 methyltransferase domain-containing protein [Stackebrandtia sp.]